MPHISINDIRFDSIRSPPLSGERIPENFYRFLRNRAPLYHALTRRPDSFPSLFPSFLSRIKSSGDPVHLSLRCIRISVNEGDRASLDPVAMDRLLTAPLVITFD